MPKTPEELNLERRRGSKGYKARGDTGCDRLCLTPRRAHVNLVKLIHHNGDMWNESINFFFFL